MKLFAMVYTDEDVTNLVATLLKSRGFDVLTTPESGQLGNSDVEQLAYATQLGRAILTHNRVDFEQLHLQFAQSQPHAGIIITPQKKPYEVAQRVGILLNALTADEIANQLLYA